MFNVMRLILAIGQPDCCYRQAHKNRSQNYGDVKKEFFHATLGIISSEIASEGAAKTASPVLQQDGNGKKNGNNDLRNGYNFHTPLGCHPERNDVTFSDKMKQRIP